MTGKLGGGRDRARAPGESKRSERAHRLKAARNNLGNGLTYDANGRSEVAPDLLKRITAVEQAVKAIPGSGGLSTSGDAFAKSYVSSGGSGGDPVLTSPTGLVGTANVRIVTADDNATQFDEVVWFDATAGAIAFTLLDASINRGRRIGLVKIDSSTNAITITDAGGGNVSFGASLVLKAQGDGAVLVAEDSQYAATADAGDLGLPVIDTTSIVEDPVDPTKEMRIDVGAVSAATVRVLTMPDQDIDLTPDTGSFIKNVVADTTPQLGGSLDTNGQTLTDQTDGEVTVDDDLQVNGDIAVTGTVDGVDVAVEAATSIHDNIAAEISAIAAKATPAIGDHLLSEDSEAADVKKSITVGQVGGLFGAFGAVVEVAMSAITWDGVESSSVTAHGISDFDNNEPTLIFLSIFIGPLLIRSSMPGIVTGFGPPIILSAFIWGANIVFSSNTDLSGAAAPIALVLYNPT